MNTLGQKIDHLDREIQLLGDILEHSAQTLLKIEDDDELLDTELRYNDEAIGITAVYAIRGFFTAVGRRNRCYRTLTRLWQLSRLDLQTGSISDHSDILESRGFNNARALLKRVHETTLCITLFQRRQALSEWHSNSNEPLATQLFDYLASLWREFAFLSECRSANSISVLMEQNFSVVREIARGLEFNETRRLRSAMRSLLAREGLYEWVDLGDSYNLNSEPSLRYRNIVNSVFSNNETGSNVFMNRIDVDDFFPEISVNLDGMGIAKALFERLADIISGYGDLEDVVSEIHHSEAHAGEPPFNIIPSNYTSDGECKPILVAFATGVAGKRGLRSVFRQIREHLITCGDSGCSGSGPTRTVILFTDSWDPQVVKESEADWEAHVSHSIVPKTFIGALVSGSKISPVSFP